MKYTLRQWRSLRDMTIQALADAVGVDYTTIWNWEHGQMPNARQIPKIEQALNIKWSSIKWESPKKQTDVSVPKE